MGNTSAERLSSFSVRVIMPTASAFWAFSIGFRIRARLSEDTALTTTKRLGTCPSSEEDGPYSAMETSSSPRAFSSSLASFSLVVRGFIYY